MGCWHEWSAGWTRGFRCAVGLLSLRDCLYFMQDQEAELAHEALSSIWVQFPLMEAFVIPWSHCPLHESSMFEGRILHMDGNW